MDFELSAEQVMLRDQSRKFLAEKSPLSSARSMLDGDVSVGKELWPQIAEMGWCATVIPEEYGGLGLTYFELAVLAEEVGRSLCPSPFSSSTYLATEAIKLFGSEEQKRTWLPQLASGDVVGAFAFSETGGRLTPNTIDTKASNSTISGVKSAVPDAELADFVVVLAAGPDENDFGLYLVESRDIRIIPLDALDPTRRYADIVLEDALADPLADSLKIGWMSLQTLLDRAAVLYAWEQLGGAEAAFEMSKEYAMSRYVFGRPIASFQAIKHKMAHMFVLNTLARSNAYFGAWALASDSPDLAEAAATARLSATQAFNYSAKENIQIHGGMGYTWEFDCHLFYRRAKALALVVGSEGIWVDRLIESTDQRGGLSA